jgi:hypothetical protein
LAGPWPRPKELTTHQGIVGDGEGSGLESNENDATDDGCKKGVMNSDAIIGLSVLLCFIAFSIVAVNYITPRLQASSRENAIKALAVPHMFRFVGLAFLMPGVVSPTLSPAFANPAAYGDLAAAILAMIAVLGLSVRASWAMLAVWIFNIEGTADLLFAYYQGIVGAPQPPGSLGAAFFIPTLIVPPLLVTHALMFRQLLRGKAQLP